MNRLFVDMDGTLAKFQPIRVLEDLYEQGYFERLPPQQNVVDAVKCVCNSAPDTEVFILSSVLTDSAFAKKEKESWLNRYIPEIDAGHRIFLSCGDHKTLYAPGAIEKGDLLLDDYTRNLVDWKRAGGTGVKLLNGINHTHGSWCGARINCTYAPTHLANALLAIADGRCVQDTPLFPENVQSAAARLCTADEFDCEPEF